MTEAQAEEAERQWNAYHAKAQAISVLRSFGLNEHDLVKEQSHGAKSENEALVALLTRIAVTSSDPQIRGMAYYQLATLADREGRKFVDLLREKARCELLSLKQSGVVPKVKIVNNSPVTPCVACVARIGEVLSIDDALRIMPLPCRTCTCTLLGEQSGFCRCSYEAVFDDE